MKIIFILLFGVIIFPQVNAANKAVTHNLNSPYVKLRSINLADTQWTEGFWADKVKLAETVMVPHMGTLLKGDIGHGFNNLKIAAGIKTGDHKGWPWHDGDFYKWMEASMYVYVLNKDPNILTELDDIIAVIARAQLDNGYLSSYNTIRGLKPWSQRQHHELYNSGHLITSAIVHKRITGQSNFFTIAVKHADYLYKVFQPRPAKLARFGFNPSQIMALVELYRETKDKRYLELAEIFIDMRGAVKVARVDQDSIVGYNHIGDMVQERTPLREETNAVGHAVLAMYLYAGAADVYAETGEKALLEALERVWSSANERRMYVTGALGQTHHGVSANNDMIHEGFINDYMMPNSTAYNETCANVSNAMFNWRMLSIQGDAKHADIIELVMYNSALSGISADGRHYYYSNPLRKVDGVWDYSKTQTEHADRQAYINCFCCPPNLVRTIAKLSGWAYSLTNDGISVNLYGGNSLNTKLLDGSVLKLTQVSQYPWEGTVAITIEEAKDAAFEIMLRIPEWAEGAELTVNGKETDVAIKPGTFANITRQWRKGDVIALDMPMEVTFVEGHQRIEEVRNQIAIKRGPVVYALETPDLPKGIDIMDVYIPSNAKLSAKYHSEFLGGMAIISGDVLIRKDKGEGMYRKVNNVKMTKHHINFIPYFAWSNRGEAEMTVFLPMVWQPEIPKSESSAWWPFK